MTTGGSYPGRAATAFAALVSVAVAGSMLAACAYGPKSSSQATDVSGATNECAAAALAVTGRMGERLHPKYVPDGLILETGRETELGQRGLFYIGAPSADRVWLELDKKSTASLPAGLLDEVRSPTVIVHGKRAVTAGTPGETFNIAWQESVGVVLIVTGHRLSAAQVIAVARGLEYTPGTTFTYPIRPQVDVSREQAIAKLSSTGSRTHAVLSSFGEVDAVLSGETQPLNHEPVLDPSIEVGRAVWLVWDDSGKGALVDANTGGVLVGLPNVKQTSAASVTDRSKRGCAPPFGVLTRTEIRYLTGAPTPTTTLKLVTLGTLLDLSETAPLGNCGLHECDRAVPVWMMVRSAADCSLLMRCGPLPGQSPWPSAPAGSWSLMPFDARTGAQTGFATAAGGRGPVPLALTNLPDLEPN